MISTDLWKQLDTTSKEVCEKSIAREWEHIQQNITKQLVAVAKTGERSLTMYIEHAMNGDRLVELCKAHEGFTCSTSRGVNGPSIKVIISF